MGSLRVLMIEGSEADATLVLRELERAGHEVEHQRVEDAEAMKAALAGQWWDAIASDWELPGFSAPLALDVLKKSGREIAFIVVSGTVGEEAAVEAMRAGAHDLIRKDKLHRLAPAVERAVREVRMRAAQREYECVKAAILNASLDAIIGIDHRGLITEFSPAAERTFGYAAHEALGKSLTELLAPTSPHETVGRQLKRYLATGEGPVIGKRAEVTALRRDGVTFPVELAIAPIGLSAPTRFIAFARDISEQRRAEQGLRLSESALRRTEEQLRHALKMEAVGQLAGGLAHDFNNILSVILSSSSMLLGAMGAADPRREDAEEIKLAAERAAALSRQMLAFSRKQVLEPRPLDLNGVVAGLEKMLCRVLGEDIELTTALAPDLGVIIADAGQIEQVIINLAVNARDAMPDGGKLRIDTANTELSAACGLEHACMKPGRYALVAVSDTGVGMDPATLQRVFEPFFTTKEKGKGTGLGLSTCYGIVKQSGGCIEVCSEPGQGTVFKVYLPLVDDARPPETAARKAPQRLGGTERLLLVEDDDRVRAVAKKILEALGYSVVAACDGQQALDWVRQGEPLDLVVTDVVMPSMSGFELVEGLRMLRPGLRALFMSGYMDRSLAGGSTLDPAASLLQKPFTPEVLARKVREALDA